MKDGMGMGDFVQGSLSSTAKGTFWQKKQRKTIFTLNVDNYSKEITDLTYPLIRRYADKINADFFIINERKFPDFPIPYEKLQIYELAQQMGNDWNIFFDSDTLIHPDFFDPTTLVKKDTIIHNGCDFAGNRWRYDRYFLKDGRNIGSCNWCTMASDWCIDLWKPLDDLTLSEALENIYPIQYELNTVITKEHLLDDYTLSRNIAKYGFKFNTICQMLKDVNDTGSYLWHQYTINTEEKIKQMKEMLNTWKVGV